MLPSASLALNLLLESQFVNLKYASSAVLILYLQGDNFKWTTIETLLTMHLTVKFKGIGNPPCFYQNREI